MKKRKIIVCWLECKYPALKSEFDALKRQRSYKCAKFFFWRATKFRIHFDLEMNDLAHRSTCFVQRASFTVSICRFFCWQMLKSSLLWCKHDEMNSRHHTNSYDFCTKKGFKTRTKEMTERKREKNSFTAFVFKFMSDCDARWEMMVRGEQTTCRFLRMMAINFIAFNLTVKHKHFFLFLSLWLNGEQKNMRKCRIFYLNLMRQSSQTEDDHRRRRHNVVQYAVRYYYSYKSLSSDSNLKVSSVWNG